MDAESFFQRWARPKPAQAEVKPNGPNEPALEVRKPPPTLEDVAALTPDSDFTSFVARGVDETVQRSALKKLFSDPRFNVMDGLDTYIEDYGKFEPIPAAMLASMNHAQALLKPLERLENSLMQLLETPDEPPQEAQEAQAEADQENIPEKPADDDTI